MESTISYGHPYASARIQTGTNCSENKSTPEHTTAISGSGNPGLPKLLEVATLFQIAKGAMIIEEVRQAVSQWPSLALNNEVSTSTINEVMRHLNEINTRF